MEEWRREEKQVLFGIRKQKKRKHNTEETRDGNIHVSHRWLESVLFYEKYVRWTYNSYKQENIEEVLLGGKVKIPLVQHWAQFS